MKRHWLWILWASLPLLLWGCAQGSTDTRPPEIRYGEDSCSECNMIISDPRFAAAYVYEVSPGRYAKLPFDDIGDMLVHIGKNPDHKIVNWYVHDYQTEEWLDATSAYFVVGETIVTPMGHGLAAFADEAAAHTATEESGGELLTWDALQAHELDPSAHQHSDMETMQHSSTK